MEGGQRCAHQKVLRVADVRLATERLANAQARLTLDCDRSSHRKPHPQVFALSILLDGASDLAHVRRRAHLDGKLKPLWLSTCHHLSPCQ